MRLLFILLLGFGYSQKVALGDLQGQNYKIYYWITSKLGINPNMIETIFTVVFITIIFFLIYYHFKKSND